MVANMSGFKAYPIDEKRLFFSNYSPWKHRPSLYHLDRSAAKWRDLRFSSPFLEMFFDRPRSGEVSFPGQAS
jgi:hypothetical protein